MNQIEHLKNLGFIQVGTWNSKNIEFEISTNLKYKDDYYSCLYAITINEKIKYIGYTSKSIEERTKTSNHQKIQDHCNEFNEKSHIYMGFYQDISFGQYYLDLAQGMEYCLIDVFKSEWNIDGNTNKYSPSKDKKGLNYEKNKK